MLKLLIVEDERITRESLESLIPWEDLGISSIKSARNGQEALKVVENFAPDILLCDVRMPKMDGIEFSKHLKSLFPKCKIVFISGYAEKEYLLSAIHLNAIDYIEKPLDVEKITQTMKRVVELINKEREEEENKKRLMEYYNESFCYICSQIVQQLLKDEPDYDLLERYGMADFVSSHLIPIVGIVKWKKEETQTSVNDILRYIYQETFNKLGEENEIPFLFSFTSSNSFVAIFKRKDKIDDVKTREFVSLLKERLSKFCDISLAIGEPTHSSKIKSCLEEMGKFIHTKIFYHGFGSFYIYKSLKSNEEYKLPFNLEMYERFLKDDGVKKVKEEIERFCFWLKSNEYPNIEKVKNLFFEMVIIAYEIGKQRRITQRLDEDGRVQKWKEIDQKITLDEIREVLYETLDGIFDILNQRGNLNKKAYQIMKFIEENYFDKELTIQKIANHFYFSPNYLCAMFKKATGKTLNDYITEVRIEKAKELLKDDSIKLYEVAEKVGFSDPNYFSTIFKKKVGLTPSDFRERYYV
ncbi:response regulator [Caldicellulosiruptor changbaiensis]|uniref:Response regulator n=1 Tax=Caldicellulosiruptor changbaiensis TaxID=1222016 RepID=A0A3T0D7T8_9FIRM|nr:response regulator [Caldicellulosiruptor changbaiensis]AZT91205.1 response regulator [Caldicellulosiruptor changbaiensis]